MGHDDPQLRVASHHPLLGTAIELRIVGPPSVTQLAEVTVVAETQRLEHVFSAFAETSELNRWRHGPTDSVSDEFSSLLRTALRWADGRSRCLQPRRRSPPTTSTPARCRAEWDKNGTIDFLNISEFVRHLAEGPFRMVQRDARQSEEQDDQQADHARVDLDPTHPVARRLLAPAPR